MKDTLIDILYNCTYNKTFNDFKKVEKIIVTLENYDLELANIVHDTNDINFGYESIFISFWTTYQNKIKLISVLFNSSNYMAISQICGCHDTIYNDSYNVQFNDIKDLLIG